MMDPAGVDAGPQHPAYGLPRPVTALSTALLCHNPSEMTFEGTNTYVLRAPGSPSCVIIDPGPDDEEHQRLVSECAGEVDLILVTHRHRDHTGGIDGLHSRVGAPVRAVRAEHCRGAEPLGDGEEIRAAGLRLTVLATPGHTADSMCVLVRAEDSPSGEIDSIVLGDTILGRDSTVLDASDGDLGEYLESLRLLAEHGCGVTGLPGHGPEVADTAAVAVQLSEHRRARLEQVRRARAELGADADVTALTRHIYTDLTPFLLQVAEQSTQVALRYLQRLEG